MDSIPVGAKMSDTKALATESSARKEKGKKDYVPEDPDSDPTSSESLSSDSDFSNESNYKRKRIHKKKKY